MNRISIPLRVVAGVVLVAAVVQAGHAGRSPWSIGPLALVFAVLFVVGQPVLVGRLGTASLLREVARAVPAQVLVVGLLYGVGFAAGTLAGTREGVAPLGEADTTRAALLLAVVGVLGGVATVLDLRSGDPLRDGSADELVARLLGELDVPGEGGADEEGGDEAGPDEGARGGDDVS